jgi:hypothetical protein
VYAFNAYSGDFEIDLGNPSSGTSRKRAREQQRQAAAAASGGDARDGGRFAKDDVLAGWGSASAGGAPAMGGGADASRGGDTIEPPHGGGCVLGVDWAPDGRYLASCDDKGRVVLWTD